MSDMPKAGQTHRLQTTVDGDRTALALADDGEALPEVFATPFMIADMERACAALLAPILGKGDVSVGACIEITHTAPTPVGDTVKTTATFTEKAGSLYWFDVTAEDSAGRIGSGRIARAIVDRDRLMSKAGPRP